MKTGALPVTVYFVSLKMLRSTDSTLHKISYHSHTVFRLTVCPNMEEQVLKNIWDQHPGTKYILGQIDGDAITIDSIRSLTGKLTDEVSAIPIHRVYSHRQIM